jgi:ribosomal protein S18 acetylase RimI-like enzyme
MTPRFIVRAMQRNIVAVFEKLVRTLPGAQLYAGNELSWTLTKVPFAVFNSIFAARLDAATAGDQIEAVKVRAERNGVPVLWWIASGDTPADLAQRLTQAGFAYAATLPGMSLDLTDLPADAPAAGALDDVTIAGVSDDRTARIWCDVFARGFGFPKTIGDEFLPLAIESAGERDAAYRNYVLSWRGEAVAAASAMLTGDVAGIYNVATLPHARRRGFGGALTAHAVRNARNRGASVAVLQSSEAGLRVYQALGFRERCRFEQFIFTPEDSAERRVSTP